MVKQKIKGLGIAIGIVSKIHLELGLARIGGVMVRLSGHRPLMDGVGGEGEGGSGCGCYRSRSCGVREKIVGGAEHA